MAPGQTRLLQDINLKNLGAYIYLYNSGRDSHSYLGRDSLQERLQAKQSDSVEKLVRLPYLVCADFVPGSLTLVENRNPHAAE